MSSDVYQDMKLDIDHVLNSVPNSGKFVAHIPCSFIPCQDKKQKKIVKIKTLHNTLFTIAHKRSAVLMDVGQQFKAAHIV